MKTLVLNGAEVRALGFPQGKVIGTVISVISDNYTIEQKEYVMNLLRAIIKHPEKFRNHDTYGEIISELGGNVSNKKERVGTVAPHINENVLCGAPSC